MINEKDNAMTANLLEAETQSEGGVDAVPEKFRDPRTGEIRLDLLVKSYRAPTETCRYGVRAGR